MSLQTAYTTGFRSLDGNTWQIRIDVDGHQGAPVEISLEGDEPCVIEWQETGKLDVVQSATCTLRVSNESDRQMLQLINRPEAVVYVSLNGKEYWRGMLDDAVYEEPYSYTQAYVTELTFSDFGPLNRRPFTLRGRQSVKAIIDHCLDGSGLEFLYQELLTPLIEAKKPYTSITLDMLYINADRFAPDPDSWGDATSRREVLEEVLRPLGLRIMQKKQCIHIYDPEWLRDHGNFHNPIVWKGTDANLRGSEKYGRFEVGFDTDANETLAELGIDTDNEAFTDCDNLFGAIYSEEFSSIGSHLIPGFFVETYRNPDTHPLQPNHVNIPAVSFPHSAVTILGRAQWFRTRPLLADASEVGIGWRIRCMRISGYSQSNEPIIAHVTPIGNKTGKSLADTRDVFTVETGYLPIVPDADSYQLRVSLDILLSFRDDPIDSPPEEWVMQQPWYISAFRERSWRVINNRCLMVPAKLEVIDENGQAVFHYVNASIRDVYSPDVYFVVPVAKVTQKGIGQGCWVAGSASGFGDMVLSYYKDWEPDDDDRDPLVTRGWTGNRQTCNNLLFVKASLYSVRDDGEYVPLPPVAGRLRLTVGSGIFPDPDIVESQIIGPCYQNFAWHLFRNPKIAIVRANRRDDGIKTDPARERRDGLADSDLLSETTAAGTWHKGVAPSARGLFFDYDGHVWEKFRKGVLERTLEELRINYLEEQTSAVQPELDGTAELDPQFGAKTEALTPGVFLVTALRQDLHLGTEHVTMARLANAVGFDYGFAWGDPLCILVEEPYRFKWTEPVCAQVPGPFRFEWSNPVCAMNYEYTLEWDEMPPEKPDN